MREIRSILFACCLLCVSLESLVRADDAVYIPFDVADAVRELDRILDPATKASVLKAEEDRARIAQGGIDPFTGDEQGVFSRPIGMQVRNRWRLWHEDSRLARYFYTKGIYNADLMWGVVADAYHAKLNKKPFVLRTSIRDILSMYPSSVNLPKGLRDLPPDFKHLHISHYIQRDDLFAIHVFSTNDGKPKWIFIPGEGWSAPDKLMLELIGTKETIVVPQPPPIDSTEAFPPLPVEPKTKP